MCALALNTAHTTFHMDSFVPIIVGSSIAFGFGIFNARFYWLFPIRLVCMFNMGLQPKSAAALKTTNLQWMQPINNRCMTFSNHNIQTISFPTHNHLVITRNNASKRFSDRCLLNCHRNDCSFSHSEISYEGIRALLDAICCAYRD